MGKKGNTISITIPQPLVEELQEASNKVGISRSRFISNLLLKWQDTKNQIVIQDTKIGSPNDCSLRDPIDGVCKSEGHICQAPQSEALTCALYIGK